MVPTRPTFWNISGTSQFLIYILGAVAVLVFTGGLVLHLLQWWRGQREPFFWPGFLRAAIRRIVTAVLLQKRLSKDAYTALTHLSIFWGMVLLTLGTAIATLDWDVAHLLFRRQFLRGTVYGLFEFVLDLAGVALLLGIILAAIRRYILRPTRIVEPVSKRDQLQSAYLLAVLGFITITGFLVEALRISSGRRLVASSVNSPDGDGLANLSKSSEPAGDLNAAEAATAWGTWAPVGNGLGIILRNTPLEQLRVWHGIAWWVHALAAFAFLVSVPFTKGYHLVAAAVNAISPPPPFSDPLSSGSASGPKTLNDLSWRELVQIDSCTSCGWCQNACPSYTSGTGFSPKQLIWHLNAELHERVWHMPFARKKSNGQHRVEQILPEVPFWSCFTCRACEAECPVLVEHTRLVVKLRRSLIDKGKVDEGIQEALVRWQRYGNSFGQSARKRAEWVKLLGFPIPNALQEPVDYLWFVGDYASFDTRVREATLATARLLHKAEVRFGLLFDKERNSGNDARRIGEEGLFEYLREENLIDLLMAQCNALFSTDPHSYHVLKREYILKPTGSEATPIAASKPVLHHTELILELLETGRLKAVRQFKHRVTYHDACYLGRYNGVYEAPRQILRRLGCELVEMPRNRERSFCCGAGGGGIWLKDVPGAGPRPAELRVREAISLGGVEYIVVACPKDFVMFTDAVKAAGTEKQIGVLDIAQVVWECVRDEATESLGG